MILVAGGTGRLGTLLVKRLTARGHQVRILTRDPARAEHLAGAQVTVMRGDVRDRQCLVPALAGVETVVSAVHGFNQAARDSLAAVDRDGNANLIDAAQAAGARFVLTSTVGAAPNSPMELFRMKYAAEQRAAESEVPCTVVRATAFLELWIEVLEQTAARSGRPLVFGHGQNPINFVSVGDVAAVVECAVQDPDARGETLEIGGPANLTFTQLAQAVQGAAGRTAPPKHVPSPMLRLMANTVGRVKPQLGRQARAALAMDQVDLTFDTVAIHNLYPELPCTSAADVLAGGRESRLEVAGEQQPPAT
jgi:NADH dehydrogenase